MNKFLKSMLNLMILTTVLISCVSRPESGSSMSFLTPDQLFDKDIVGMTDDGFAFTMTISMDNKLTYVEDGNVYIGTWDYDGTRALMAYTLDWDKDGSPQGYLTTISIEGDTITIMGNWYITDIYKTFFLKGEISE